MLDRAEDFLGRVTFVTGPEKHCGKTTFMNRALELARRGARTGGLPAPAVLTVGYDGEARDFLSGARKPAVPVSAGDVVVTTERFASPCQPEILEVLPGSTALGRLCVARARRGATVALVGPDGNAQVAWAIDRILGSGMSDTVIVDGAFNRITQAAAMPGARFVYVLRVDAAGLDKAVARVRRMGCLVGLPVAADYGSADGRGVADLGAGADTVRGVPYRLDDALTSETAARLPREARAVVVSDFTKIFLSDSELAVFGRERTLYVGRSIEFGGFVVSCRGVSDGEFSDRLGDDALSAIVAFNPYEARAGRVA